MKEGFWIRMGVMAYIVTSLLSGRQYCETALAYAPLSVNVHLLQPNYEPPPAYM